MGKPIMAKATAVWLVDNTTLTFKQIADFTGMHELEVQGIADGDVAAGVKGFDPYVFWLFAEMSVSFGSFGSIICSNVNPTLPIGTANTGLPLTVTPSRETTSFWQLDRKTVSKRA